ncbi:MAG: ATP-binding protein [Carnobacterium sp.]|nr:ATP-binding protein [Carnobacterium sp.]
MILLEKLLEFGLGEVSSTLKNKTKEHSIMKKLTAITGTFNEEFNDTEIDTNTFESFITESPLISSYFTKMFLEGNIMDNEYLDKIVQDIINKINAKKASQGVSPFTDENLIRDYFMSLTNRLIEERTHILGIENQLLSAQIIEKVVTAINSVLEEQLIKPSNENFKFTSQLLYNQNQNSIISLGERYSPEINIETMGSFPFETLFQTTIFYNELFQLYNDIVVNYNYFASAHEDDRYIEVELINHDQLLVNDIISSVKKIEESTDKTYDEIKTLGDIQKHHFYEFKRSLSEFYDFIAISKIKLYDEPYLIITGEAAIGKSHLLADNVEKMQREGYPIIFLLGQQFLTTKDPLQQIVERFGYSISVEEFLYQFNNFSEIQRKRACIIIDALNETDSNSFWKNQLQSFTSKIAQYPNIGIIFSIRSTYISNILPQNFVEENKFNIYHHNGITNAEDQEIEKIENQYSLKRGELLKIYPEFSNPLFLKIAALSSSLNGSLEHEITWEKLISQYIKKTEKDISSEQRLSYKGKYLALVLQVISRDMFENNSNFLNYRDIKRKIAKELEYDMDTGKQYIDELVRENILSKFSNFEGEEKIHFTYEKIHDFLIADMILKDFKDDKSQLVDLINNTLLPNRDYGVIEILFFMIPNKYDMEITDLISPVEKEYNLHRAFIGSISWRKYTLKSESISQILKEILRNDYLASEFFDRQFLLAVDPSSPFNSAWLSKWLINLSNDLLDYLWTARISKSYSSFSMQFIKRIKRNYASMNEVQLELALNQLIWLLSSVNRNIRDRSTKLISLILVKQPEITISILNKFSKVTDYYILERLYAAVFGAIVKLEDNSLIEKISFIVYKEIFEQEEVVPHILLRDYARQIIEFAISKNLCESITQEKIKPPYNSPWYEFTFSNDDVDKLEKYYETVNKDNSYAVYRIKSSMITEYGRGTGAYGDFGRYTFGSIVSDWENQFDDQDLSNIAFKRIFELGYNPQLHSRFDQDEVSGYDRHNHRIERIGKKYQWIALYELLARLADNFPIYKEKIIYDDEYEEFRRKRGRNLFFLIDNGSRNDEEGITQKNEDLIVKPLKAEDHILETKRENIRYFQGAYESYLRTIDPTYLFEIPSTNGRLMSYSYETSLNNDRLFSSHKQFIENNFEGKDYTNLRVSYSNKTVRNNNKFSSDLSAVAFFCKTRDIDNIIEINTKNYGQGVSAPDSTNIFMHELFWSPAYRFFEEQIYDYSDKCDLSENAIFEYFWESNQDYSINAPIRICNPSKKLVEYFHLTSVNEGIWKDEMGNVVAFDGIVYGYESSLWFETEKLIEYLKETEQVVLWRSWGQEIENHDFIEKWFLIEKDGNSYRTHISNIETGDYKNVY